MARDHFLVVEDDDAIRHLLVEFLGVHFATHIDSARDGVDALHFIRQRSYGVVILDVMMPHMTGIDFLDSVQALQFDRSVQTLRELPAVIVITGATADEIQDGQIEERFPQLVRDVLRKPLEMEKLRECVRRYV
jgi:CheY-like chemotaxis protein